MIKDDSNIDKYQVTGWGLWRDDLKPIILNTPKNINANKWLNNKCTAKNDKRNKF